MKVKIFKCLILFAIVISCEKEGKTPGDIILTNQQQVDKFSQIVVDGDLIIQGDYISNLDGLRKLTRIKGHLNIKSNHLLKSLKGLNNLSRVDSNVVIRDNSLLANLQDLAQIHGKIGSLIIDRNPDLESLEGLSGVSEITDVIISLCPKLMDMSGLEGLEKAYLISARENSNLKDYTGLESLKEVSIIHSERNNALVNYIGFEEIIELDYLRLNDSKVLSFDGFQNICKINKDFMLSGNTELEEISSLESLQEVGFLEIRDCPKMKLFNSASLMKLDVLSLDNNSLLMEVDINTSLLCSEVRINNCGFTNIDFTEVLDGVNKVWIGNCPYLVNTPRLANATTMDSISFYSLPKVKSLINMKGISKVGFFQLDNLELIADLDGLQDIKVIGELHVNRNTKLTSLTGLNSLEELSHKLVIGGYEQVDLGNAQLIDFCALSNMMNNHPPKDFFIYNNAYNPSLEDFSNNKCKQP